MTNPTAVSPRDFVTEAVNSNGAIELETLSDETKPALGAAEISEQPLGHVAEVSQVRTYRTPPTP